MESIIFGLHDETLGLNILNPKKNLFYPTASSKLPKEKILQLKKSAQHSPSQVSVATPNFLCLTPPIVRSPVVDHGATYQDPPRRAATQAHGMDLADEWLIFMVFM